ncbi:unnamed protein product [Caretta caretta]
MSQEMENRQQQNGVLTRGKRAQPTQPGMRGTSHWEEERGEMHVSNTNQVHMIQFMSVPEKAPCSSRLIWAMLGGDGGGGGECVAKQHSLYIKKINPIIMA